MGTLIWIVYPFLLLIANIGTTRAAEEDLELEPVFFVNGKAYASSVYQNIQAKYGPENAFRRQMSTSYRGSWLSGSAPFSTDYVWFDFMEEGFAIAKFSFRNRREIAHLTNNPTNFALIGSNDCEANPSERTIIQEYEEEEWKQDLKEIDWKQGSAGATSEYRKRGANMAFTTGWKHAGWINAANDAFPITWWSRLPEKVKVAKLSFSSRKYNSLHQSPTEFELVGSNDCETWTNISTFQADFTGLNQIKTWEVPKDLRKTFGCMGIRVNSVKSGPYAAITGLKMWTESENDVEKIFDVEEGNRAKFRCAGILVTSISGNNVVGIQNVKMWTAEASIRTRRLVKMIEMLETELLQLHSELKAKTEPIPYLKTNLEELISKSQPRCQTGTVSCTACGGVDGLGYFVTKKEFDVVFSPKFKTPPTVSMAITSLKMTSSDSGNADKYGFWAHASEIKYSGFTAALLMGDYKFHDFSAIWIACGEE